MLILMERECDAAVIVLEVMNVRVVTGASVRLFEVVTGNVGNVSLMGGDTMDQMSTSKRMLAACG